MVIIFDLYNVLYPYSDEAEFVVAELRSRGFKIATISSMSAVKVNEIAMKYGIEIVLSAQDTLYSKRDPELYRFFLDKFGLKANECLIVDDEMEKLTAAKQAGIRTCLLNVGWQEENSAADYIVNSLKQLLTLKFK